MTLGSHAQLPFLHGQTATLRDGDLLFYADSVSNPITDVTQGIHGYPISHVAIVRIISNQVFTLEAIHRGVVLQPVDSTMLHRRTGGHIFVGRVTAAWDREQSMKNAMSYIGRPYDFYFDDTDSALYCSELVQKSYVDHQGHHLFPTIPMSFHNQAGVITSYWTEYYRKAGRQVPEGAPGSNPGNLSRNGKLKIISQFI